MTDIQKVAAYILRKNVKGNDELLVFAHRDFPDVPIQVPGGTVEFGEHPDDAVVREIMEESGLTELQLIKKLGDIRIQGDGSHKSLQRFFYLFRVPETTADSWDHRVGGNGEDVGLVFSYKWYDAQSLLYMHESFHHYLTPENVPSLFPNDQMLGLSRERISLVPHTTLWKQQFEQDKDMILKYVQPLDPQIEHIGSTAIPDIPAKPILDIGIGVETKKHAEIITQALVSLGYDYKGEYGIAGRYYFTKGRPEKRTHHIHMFIKKHPEWEKHLRFRDYMLSHPDAAKEYGQLKLALWRDPKITRADYPDAKGPFIRKILDKA